MPFCQVQLSPNLLDAYVLHMVALVSMGNYSLRPTLTTSPQWFPLQTSALMISSSYHTMTEVMLGDFPGNSPLHWAHNYSAVIGTILLTGHTGTYHVHVIVVHVHAM